MSEKQINWCLCLEGSFDSSDKQLATIGTFKTLRTDLKRVLGGCLTKRILRGECI